jgi:phosphoribosylformimino-5-aminoimidazole carboxamide ribotide isomerase
MVMPAVDIRESACVQLVGGSYDDERVRLTDPLAAARAWRECGFRQLHVVDLDAATDRGWNGDVVRTVIQGSEMEVQVGGGVSTDASIGALLRDGAHRVVVGTRAIEHVDWLRAMSQTFPARLILAADVRERQVVTRGWRYDSGRQVLDVVAEMGALPLAGIMVTAVHREGQMTGPDLDLVESLVDAAGRMPIYVAGGIATLEDLRALASLGATAAVVGMALYTGALDARAVAMEFVQ